MQINRRGPSEASLTQDGRELVDMVALDAGDEEFAALLDKLEQWLAVQQAALRVALNYREGLLGQVEADLPVELFVIEEDPHDNPPARLFQRSVPAQPGALDSMLATAEHRLQIRRDLAP